MTEYGHQISYFQKYVCVEIWILVNTTVSILSNLLCGFNVFLFGLAWDDFAIFLFCIYHEIVC